MFIFLFLLCSVVLLLIYYVLSINRNYWSKRNVVESSKGSWNFIFSKCSLPEVYKSLYDAFPNENYVGMYIGFKPVLVLRNLEDIQAVLISEFQSFSSRGYVLNSKEFLADNLLLTIDYLRWKLIRQKISPIFTSLKLKTMYPQINRCASDFVKNQRKNKEVMEDPLQAFSKYSSATISASILGLQPDTENYMESPLSEHAWNSSDNLALFTLKAVLCCIFPKLFNLLNISMFGNHEKVVLGFIQNLLKSKQKLSSKKLDFINLCLDMKQKGIQDNVTGYRINVNDEFLAAQAFSFLLAGVDTTANAMNFILLELANNQAILNKVHREIDEAFKGKNLSYQDVDNLEYLNMVLNESLRKYPPLGSIQRLCTKDTNLPSDLRVEKGTIVVIPVYALHMDENFFPKPHSFDPERFASENIYKINKFAYLPFGEGNRICIGAKYARLQIKTAVALLLREYTLKSCMYSVENFEPSFFNLRDAGIKYDIIPRQV